MRSYALGNAVDGRLALCGTSFSHCQQQPASVKTRDLPAIGVAMPRWLPRLCSLGFAQVRRGWDVGGARANCVPCETPRFSSNVNLG